MIGIIGKSAPMMEVFRMIHLAAETDLSVMIIGESGTGKELVARAIHNASLRKKGPFIAVNIGALTPDLVANELFGHERGAFTGAHTQTAGAFERAYGGTLFLDEVGTIDQKTQVTLLRAIEDKAFYRVGGKDLIHVDVRILCATNEDLQAFVRKETFRKDLYFRMEGFIIRLPALQERKEDIPLLAREFLQEYNAKYKKSVTDFSPEAIDLFVNYRWPGNVREMKNVIQRAVLLTLRNTIVPEYLPRRLHQKQAPNNKIVFDVGVSLGDAEKTLIIRTLKDKKGNKTATAKTLGISRRSLYNKIQQLNIRC
ncbi:MAG TPA: sigma-54 dependent transcriptional regulator [Candidatus Manganitrophaceae bacterium]|nr:sigma-54 dependent transcriptional regulator [Candidatus Manganitrophaceae bacterium]